MAKTDSKPLPDFPPAEVQRFWSLVDRRGDDECWPWLGTKLKPYNYGVFFLSRKVVRELGVRRFSIASRIAFKLATGRDPQNALHRCDNPPCCNPNHLFDGSHADNVADKVAKGRQGAARGGRSGRRLHPERFPQGESTWNAKLNEQVVVEIRKRWKSGGCTYSGLGVEYGVDATVIRAAILRRTWKHV